MSLRSRKRKNERMAESWRARVRLSMPAERRWARKERKSADASASRSFSPGGRAQMHGEKIQELRQVAAIGGDGVGRTSPGVPELLEEIRDGRGGVAGRRKFERIDRRVLRHGVKPTSQCLTGNDEG